LQQNVVDRRRLDSSRLRATTTDRRSIVNVKRNCRFIYTSHGSGLDRSRQETGNDRAPHALLWTASGIHCHLLTKRLSPQWQLDTLPPMAISVLSGD